MAKGRKEKEGERRESNEGRRRGEYQRGEGREGQREGWGRRKAESQRGELVGKSEERRGGGWIREGWGYRMRAKIGNREREMRIKKRRKDAKRGGGIAGERE